MGLFGNIARSVSRKVVKGLKRTVPRVIRGIKTSGPRILKGIKSGINRAGQAIKSAVKKVKGLFKGKPKGTGKLFTEGDPVILKDTVYTPFSQIRGTKEAVKSGGRTSLKKQRKAQERSINLLLQN